MANKHRGEPRMYQLAERLIRAGLPNDRVLAQIREQFPKLRTTPEQIRFLRNDLRRTDKSIPTSVDARRLSLRNELP
jgi:hypothetical protein